MSAPPKTAKQVFVDAIEIVDPSKRDRFLREACGSDCDLRSQVDAMLDLHDQPDSLLDRPRFDARIDASLPPNATIDMPPVIEKPGTGIGPYKLREQIGEGGFGVVHVAEQTEPVRRKVALKIIKPGMDTQDVIARFEAERQALALMEHPNIAKVLDAGATDSGRPYFVMELVRGVPITEFCDEQILSTRERLQLFVDVCRAVQHAHQKGIIHRDLKPSNILVTLDDNRPIPKVIDFGIAKALSRQLTDNSIYTAYGQMIGTPLYMAPEQAQLNLRDVDTRSDVYSLGVLLYELLTGTTPFDRETLQKSGFEEMRRIICEVDPPRPSARISTLNAEALSTVSDRRKVDARKLSRSLRGELDWIVMQALEKDRNRRYETASALAADVERFLADEPVQARPASVWYRFGKFARRKKAALVFASLIALFVVTMGSGAGWVVRDRKAREDAAERERLALEEKSQREREDRRKQLSNRVEFVLEEVSKHKKAQNWIAARQANSRARTLLAGSDGHQKLKDRVQRHQKELDFIAALQDVRAKRAVAPGNGKVKVAVRDEKRYAKLFREFGIDVDQLTVVDAAAKLNSHPDILPVIATILDDWASSEALVRNSQKTAAKLWHLANSIDSDRWRNNLRDALLRGDDDALKKLARSKDVLEQPPSSLWLLGVSLSGGTGGRGGIDRDLGIELLRKASHRYPRAFWLNYRAGVLLRLSGRAKESLRYLAVAHSIRPRVYGTHHDFAIALSDAGRYKESIDEWNTHLRRRPGMWWANYGIGITYMKKGVNELALKHFQIALKARSKHLRNVYIHSRMGTLYLRLEQPDKAIPWLRKAIVGALDEKNKADSWLIPSFHNLLLAGTRAKVDVIPFLREVVQDHPKSAIARYYLALAFQGKRFVFRDGELNWSTTDDPERLRTALVEHRKAVDLDPKFGDPWVAMGRIFQYRLNKPEQAIEAYHRAIKLNYKPAECHVFAGLVYEAKSQWSQAIQEYRKAIEFDEKHADGWFRLGIVLRDDKQLKDAAKALREAIRLKPKTPTYHSALGYVCYQQRRYVDAIVEYRKALHLLPRHYDAVLRYPMVLERIGRYGAAVNAYRRALRLYPKRESIQAGLADALESEMRQSLAGRRRINFKRVHLVLNEAVKLQPKYYGFWHLFGTVHSLQSNPKRAIECWRKALALKDDSAPTHHLLGQELVRTGQASDGIKHLREAVRLKPNHLDYQIKLVIQLVNCADPRLRKPAEGLKLASWAVFVAPKHTLSWQVLGWAKYRNGDWRGSIEALQKSMQLQAGGMGDAGQWVVLAMACHQLGRATLARKYYEQSVRSIKQIPVDEYGIRRLVKEAADLLDGKRRSPVVAPRPKPKRMTGTPARR